MVPVKPAMDITIIQIVNEVQLLTAKELLMTFGNIFRVQRGFISISGGP